MHSVLLRRTNNSSAVHEQVEKTERPLIALLHQKMFRYEKGACLVCARPTVLIDATWAWTRYVSNLESVSQIWFEKFRYLCPCSTKNIRFHEKNVFDTNHVTLVTWMQSTGRRSAEKRKGTQICRQFTILSFYTTCEQWRCYGCSKWIHGI